MGTRHAKYKPMKKINPAEHDLKRWARLTEKMPDCICTGHPLYEATPELNKQDGSLGLVTRITRECLLFLKKETSKDLYGARFVIFHAHRIEIGTFGKRRIWAVQIKISKNKNHPGKDIEPVGWFAASEINILVSNIMNIIDGHGYLIDEKRLQELTQSQD